MTFSSEFCVSGNHPSLAGHYPDNPLVPAAIILDTVREMIVAEYEDSELICIRQAKFFAPLLADQTVSILVDEFEKKYRFRCFRGTDKIAEGEFLFGQEFDHRSGMDKTKRAW